jgi:hypothetical protein
MQQMELCTPHQSLADAIRVFACSVTRDGVSFVTEQPVAEGEWVAFRFLFGEDKLLLEGEGLCCEMERLGGSAVPRYRVTLAALELDGENRARHVRLFEERMRVDSHKSKPTTDTPTVQVARPTRPPEAPKGASLAATTGIVATGRRRVTTGVVTKEQSPFEDDGLETSVQEVMLFAVKAEILEQAGELLEKVSQVQGAYLARPTSIQALLEHALHLGLTVLDAQMNEYIRSA